MANAAEQPAGTQWIWADQARVAGQVVRLRKTFAISKSMQVAMLRGHADFNRMTISLNDRRAVVVDDYAQPCEVEVREFLREGENRLTVEATSSPGPAAVAISLELTYDDGTRQVIASDESWRATLAAAADWKAVATFGALAAEPWAASTGNTRISEVEDYTQWKRALNAGAVTDPATFLAPPGYELELLRTAQPDEGSWVSMAFDPRGRLIIGRESQGLLRMTLPDARGGEIRVEAVNDTLNECRGLRWAYDSLYANANESKGLYRLRDTDGDDRFDEEKLLYKSAGSAGHGRNDLTLGPDGFIYSIHGDAVDLPTGTADRTSPFREQRHGVNTREGHVLRMDRDGGSQEIICAGLRNPYGIDFNPDGEMFTYDADAEFDMGAPWYRPTRVDHLVSGADFGWRGVTGRWPPYYPDHPDNAQPVLDIGKGSPTSVKFGTRSSFPPVMQKALFILDWAYGRIVCVHLTPRGASYVGRAETFLQGRPLNVTDLDFGPDGAMYFVTGGRKTQSGLYRVRYVGPKMDEPAPTMQQTAREGHAAEARTLRCKLESLHGKPSDSAIAEAWPYLDNSDPTIRHAARIAIEHQPIANWQSRALQEARPTAALAALMALARSGDSEARAAVVGRLVKLPWETWSTDRQLEALFAYSLCLEPVKADAAAAAQLAARLDAIYPHDSAAMNQELSRLLTDLASPAVVSKTLSLLAAAPPPREHLHYLFVLSRPNLRWEAGERRAYIDALHQAERFQGGDGMPKFLKQIRADWLAAISDAERSEWAAALDAKRPPPVDESAPAATRPFVKDWRLDDLLASLPEVGQGRDRARGRATFAMLCVRCHRVGRQGAAVGPDLTSVSRRFGRRDLLDSVLSPSKVVAEQYRQTQVVTTDGRVIVGRIVPATDYRSPALHVATNPIDGEQVVQVPKDQIESHNLSDISPMPQGLLNTLTREEVLDLLAFLESQTP